MYLEYDSKETLSPFQTLGAAIEKARLPKLSLALETHCFKIYVLTSEVGWLCVYRAPRVRVDSLHLIETQRKVSNRKIIYFAFYSKT